MRFIHTDAGYQYEKIIPPFVAVVTGECLVQIHARDGRYYRYGIEIIDTYKSIDTFDTRKKYR